MPRTLRLRRREQFASALAERPAAVRRYFTLFARLNGEPEARLGIVAGRKAARRAVDRNRARRLVREVFRANRQHLGGVDVVVQLRRCPARSATAAARAELHRLLLDLGARFPAGKH